RAQELAGEVHVEHAAPCRERHLRHRGIGLDAGVRDQDVDAPEGGDAALEHAPHLLLAGDVALHGDRLAAARRDLLAHRIGGGAVREVVDGDPRAARGERAAGSGPDAAVAAGDERRLALQELHARRSTRARNSSRVASWSRKTPRTDEVTITEFCFSTPRIIMQRCFASIITPTPRAPMVSMIAREICSVSRSCSCRRRAYMSTSRASLLTPNTL